MRRAPLFVLVALCAAPALAQEVNLAKTAVSGSPLRLGYERTWDRSCAAVPAVVSVTRQPEHGTVSVVRVTSTIPPSTPRAGPTGQCAGRSIIGDEVVYQSQPGFHGLDHVSWSASYGNGRGGTTTVDITVR